MSAPEWWEPVPDPDPWPTWADDLAAMRARGPVPLPPEPPF
jgi:hypothetical protein